MMTLSHEYLTGEEILPPDHRRVIEQATFAYSPLRKSFEKQTKMIEDQGEKQIKTLEEYGKKLIKSRGEKDSLELLKQKEIFDDLVNVRMFEMNKLSKGIDFNNLTYYYTSKNARKYFVHFKGPLIIYNDIKTMDRKKFLIFIMIILEWYLMLNTNQFMEKGSKY